MALNGAGVADARGCPLLGWGRGRRVAGEAGEDALTEGTEDFGAGVNALAES